MSTPNQCYLSLPEELMSLTESYLPPSDCAHLSATSTCLHQRWTARRWHRTFQLHYGRESQITKKERSTKLRKCREILECLLKDQGPNGVRCAEIQHWLGKYGELYKEGWTLTFVGCCHDVNFSCECKHSTSSCSMSCSKIGCKLHTANRRHQQKSARYGHEDSLDDGTAFTTRFNVPALVPSIQRAYVDLWDTVELSFLGYYDAERETRTRNLHPVPSIMSTVRASVLPELAEYFYFVIGLKPLVRGGLVSRRRGSDLGVMGPMMSINNSTTMSAATISEDIDSLRNTATTMSAWKLASILRERGVGCLRCSICDCIDLVGDDIEDDSVDSISEERNIGERGSHARGRRSLFLREFQKEVGGSQAWITPCRCPELVHRQCLEKKLGLVPKYELWERLKIIGAGFGQMGSRVHNVLFHAFSKDKRHSTQSVQDNHFFESLSNSFNPGSVTIPPDVAPRVWVSYDSTIPQRRRPEDNELIRENATIAIDELGQLTSPQASCERCGCRYLRTVRLPRSKAEVLAASLSDPLSVVRALSTFIHFILKCFILAAIEGVCSDESCESHRTLLTTPWGSLKWPTTGLNGVALVMWQLQQ